jgi:hypothetical protein
VADLLTRPIDRGMGREAHNQRLLPNDQSRVTHVLWAPIMRVGRGYSDSRPDQGLRTLRAGCSYSRWSSAYLPTCSSFQALRRCCVHRDGLSSQLLAVAAGIRPRSRPLSR